MSQFLFGQLSDIISYVVFCTKRRIVRSIQITAIYGFSNRRFSSFRKQSVACVVGINAGVVRLAWVVCGANILTSASDTVVEGASAGGEEW